MAIRLRKINADAQLNVRQMASQKRQKKTLWRRARLLTLLLFLVGVGFLAYLYMFAPISSPILVQANAVDVKSPDNAVVEWIVSDSSERVKKGQLIAKLMIKVGNPVSITKKLRDKRLGLQKANIDLAGIKARMQAEKSKLSAEKSNISAKNIELKLAYELAKDAVERGRNAHKKAHEIYLARKADLEKAERLWNLDAISKSDLLAARRLYAEGEAAYQNALVFDKSLAAELKAAKQTYELKKSVQAGNMAELKDLLASATDYKTKLEEEIKTLEERVSGQGYTMELTAPMEGVLLNRFGKQGEYLSAGAVIATIYNPDTVKINAYVREDHKDDVQVGTRAKAKLAGVHFDTSVVYVRPEIVSSPPQLRDRTFGSNRTYCVVAELSRENAPANIYPGEVGRVLFSK